MVDGAYAAGRQPVHEVTSMAHGCCTPNAPHERSATRRAAASGPRASVGGAHDDGRPMRELAAATFLMGTAAGDGFPDDGEGPVREVSLRAYAIDLCAVSNDDFAAFVEESGHVTEAEHFGWSFVFKNHVPKSSFKKGLVRTVPGLAWWYAVDRACWKRPEGPGSQVRKRGDHPVTHVSHADAVAYCAWAGKRLPSEAEWEHAARGGLEQRSYAWGDELTPGGRHYCNIWQGKFPDHDQAADGYAGTGPVRAFPANGYGLHNVAGNVWEWCADWFSPDYHLTTSRTDPGGPPRGSNRVMRGGSFLCHRSYCNRYRVAARTSNTPDSSTANLGFRCARSL